MSRKKPDLTQKEQLFIREYLTDENGTRAAIAAGYSQKWAHVAASKLLKKPKVADELAKVRAKLCAELEISAKKVLQGLAQLAFFDPRRFFEPNGSLKRVLDLDDVTCMALAGITVEKQYKHYGKGQAEEVGTVTKIKLADRGQNLERLGRHLKLFITKETIELTGKITHEHFDATKLSEEQLAVAEQLIESANARGDQG